MNTTWGGPVVLPGGRPRQAAAFADQPPVLAGGRVTTFGELRAEVQRVAASLRACGVQAGDRVALFLPTVPEFVVAYQACPDAAPFRSCGLCTGCSSEMATLSLEGL
ncbi:MAG TPA: AMP-binding protein [Chloroflexota bacterium]|nr:AMP-binding protein [Chloroflexota bacterium]